MDEKPRYWFGPKMWGFGYRHPLNWRGWVAYAAWSTLWLAAAPVMRSRQHPFFDLVFFFGMIGVLLGICKWKGEP
jgi:hypothetical protein